jgi:DNA helicase-2/ATP-dependent DNA helicase PcrA
LSDFSEKLKTDLNPKQREAVETLDGPVLVLAGAGSGKTRVIAYRVANLIFTDTCQPWEILAVTFTNKAADEMRDRVHNLVGQRGHEVGLGTFHRTCSQILRKWGQEIGVPQEYTILDDTESAVAVKRCMKSLKLDIEHYDPRAVANRISGAKGNLVHWRDYQERAIDVYEKLVGEVYEAYENALKHAKALDFDDLIMKTVDLMEESPRTLARLQGRFRYILVDEYQDINKAQYVFTQLLASKDKNICVVGDDDQSIYAFRGADPKYILNFEDDFPGTLVIKLEENYRSKSRILDAANALVHHNPKRHYKELWTSRGEGEFIWFKYNRTDEAEAIYIAETIEAFRKAENRTYNDFAILYRTNALSRIFEEVFTQYAIPYQIIGGFRFYDRKEVKDVLAYLKLVQNPWDTVSLQRIINTPSRGIGDKSFTKLLQVLTEYNLGVHEIPDREDTWMQLGTYAANRTIAFCRMIRDLHEEKDNFSVFELTGMILDQSGYSRKLEQSDTIEAEGRLENIEELMGAITRFDEAYPTEGLPVFLEQVALIQATDEIDRDAESVKCLTSHSAKGLEFPVVFVAGMEDGLFPHSRSFHDPSGLEEERRLCYVSITRAMDRLFLTAAYTRSSAFWRSRNSLGGSIPSRFLAEIPENLIEPIDPESERALRGDETPPGRMPDAVREIVDREYSEMGSEWKILPSAYKFAEKQGGLVSARLKNRRAKIDDEPREPSGYAVGQMVRHPKFGVGKITKIQPAGGGDYFLQINFESEGAKLLSESKAPLEKVEEGES